MERRLAHARSGSRPAYLARFGHEGGMVMRGWVWGVLAGCTTPPVVQSNPVLDVLTIVALQAEPPQPVLGERAELSVWVANPDDEPVDVLVWTCVPLDVGVCAETELELPLTARSRLRTVEDSVAQMQLTLPEVRARDADNLRATVFAMACVPGACPMVEAMREPPPDDSEAAEEILGWMAQPITHPTPEWGRAHLAFRTMRLHRSPPKEPVYTPIVDVRGVLSTSATLVVDDPDDHDWTPWVAATGGPATWRALDERTLNVRWEFEGRPFVVITDEADGVAVWTP